MERKVGTISRGIRCPIIREGDDLVAMTVNSVLEAADNVLTFLIICIPAVSLNDMPTPSALALVHELLYQLNFIAALGEVPPAYI